MTCVFVVLFSVVWLMFFSWYFLWYDLCFFCALERRKSTNKKHKKMSISLEKMKLRPPDLDSLRTGGPANVWYHFLFPTAFPKESFRWAHARSGNVKKCNYHMMCIENLNNYCWRHAFVTLITYNLQWLDRLIAVSWYLRHSAINTVQIVVISYHHLDTVDTTHCVIISLSLLFDIRILKET